MCTRRRWRIDVHRARDARHRRALRPSYGRVLAAEIFSHPGVRATRDFIAGRFV
jgi:hypothetical protein